MSKKDLGLSRRYALLVPAVALASFGLVNKASAKDAAPSLTNSSPTTVLDNVVPELGATDGSLIAAAGLNTSESFQDNGASDSDDPVPVLVGGTSDPVMLDVAATQDSVPTLSGSGGGGIVLQTTTQGVLGDGHFDYVYDPNTGDIKVAYDGDPAITPTSPLQRLVLKSAGSKFRTNNTNPSAFGTITNQPGTIDGQQTAGAIPDGYDLGAILPSGLQAADLTSDLTLQWQVQGGGLKLKTGDIVVPEPTALGLIGVGAMGLLARRRKPE